MSFISNTACNGAIPRMLSGCTFFNRNALLATMMRDRSAPRYLVAPDGFGKSLLACSYASLINDFRHTNWFDCENPCFLRDLDAHVLVSDILDVTGQGTLVVFDNVPKLGKVRKEALWDACSKLTRCGREVVVCATPASDPLQSHKQDCVCIDPLDFLYTTADVESMRSVDAFAPSPVLMEHLATRVPALVSRDSAAFKSFLANHIADMENPDECALTFALLVFEQGSFEDVSMVLGRDITGLEIDAHWRRPFVFVDEYAQTFDARGFPLDEVLRAFAPHMARIARSMGAEAPSDMVFELASTLLRLRQARRAAKIMMSLCEPATRSRWLSENQQTFLDLCAFSAGEAVYESLRSDRWRNVASLYAASRIRRAVLGYIDGPFGGIMSVASKVEYSLDLRLQAASYTYLLSSDIQKQQELENMFAAGKGAYTREAESLDCFHRSLWEFWSTIHTETDQACYTVDAVPDGEEGTLVLACYMRFCRLAGMHFEAIPGLIDCVDAHLCGAQHDAPMQHDTFMQHDTPMQHNAHMLALCLLRREVDAYGIVFSESNSAIQATYRLCDTFEDALQVQRREYEKAKAVRAGATATLLRAQTADSNADASDHAAAIPILHVSLFGQFSVTLGDVVIAQRSFKRQKVRTLLALLMLESGHELACDNLAERLWPESDPVRARHNLYTCTSILRKELALSDGSCPYLSRAHGVLYADAQLVESDADVLAKLCRHLRFEDPDSHTCMHLLDQVSQVYRGDLLPAERNETMIIAAREEWRNRLVNTLLYAAKRLVGMGDYVSAMQFAQRALACDPQREDCYEYLMAIQARSGQRPAAIETWMRYRHFVNDELGLDPSVRMSDLYARIISDAG